MVLDFYVIKKSSKCHKSTIAKKWGNTGSMCAAALLKKLQNYHM